MAREFSQLEQKALLLLDQSPKIGAKTLKKIVHYYKKDLEKILTDPIDKIASFFEPRTASLILEARKAEFDFSNFERKGIETIFYGQKKYSKLLAEIYDPPMILYCRGNTEVLNSVSIAIVGSRKYTSYSKDVIEKFIPELVFSEVAIVSGLALGVDSLAHLATLENSGITIGVLGCGVDEIYPSTNRLLAERILKNGGAIISEFPLGTAPFKQNFPLRNRIIAGMSHGTLVVEAKKESGSLITAGLANEFGRDVFAVPGNINSFASEGTNQLIKQGAKITTEANDILTELNIQSIGSKNSIITPESKEEEKIFRSIENEPQAIDKIAKITKLDIVVVNSLMSFFEISGKVEKVDGVFRLRGKLK